jgi:hypothetical protein
MAKVVLSLAIASSLAMVASGASAQQFPCQAFQMQPNGMLAVVQPVTINSPNGGGMQISPGMSFGPGLLMMGVDFHALYLQNCR